MLGSLPGFVVVSRVYGLGIEDVRLRGLREMAPSYL